MRFKRLEDWLSWQESLHSTEIDMGLLRITDVARTMNLLQPKARVVTVAGTNGKGSCVATLEALCQESGVAVGAFTSPHLLRYNERIRINGEPVSDQVICDSFARIDSARGEISLTYFEFGALAAIDVLQRQQVDIMVLEVGLGGRLDAVNIIDADVAVVTSIAVDHEQFLGTDRENIGREKAGIFRAARPAICADFDAPLSIAAVADETSAKLIQVGGGFDFKLGSETWSWQGLTLDGQQVSLDNLPIPSLPLPSVAAALQVFLQLDLSLPATLCRLLQQVSLTGRAQQLEFQGRQFILDVAHNPAAAKYLCQRLERQPFEKGKTFAIIAAMADKDRVGLLSELVCVVDDWLVASLPHIERAAKAELLQNDLATLTQSSRAFKSVAEAIKVAIEESTSSDRIVILGSFFTVADALAVLQNNAQH